MFSHIMTKHLGRDKIFNFRDKLEIGFDIVIKFNGCLNLLNDRLFVMPFKKKCYHFYYTVIVFVMGMPDYV